MEIQFPVKCAGRKGRKVGHVVKKVGKSLNVGIEDSMLDVCYRVVKTEKDRPRFIVKFVKGNCKFV